MSLTELQVRTAKPRDKRYTMSDGRGLLLEIHPSGAKYWILRTWNAGKETRKHLGQYPDLGVKDARERAAEAKQASLRADSVKFEDAAEEWLRTRMTDKAPSYITTIRSRLRMYILPEIGNMKLTDITAGIILGVCRKAEMRGAHATASRLRLVIGQVFRFAVASDLVQSDPTQALRGALAVRKEKHMAALTEPEDIARLMRCIHAYPHTQLRIAMLMSAYTFARPGEIRHAEWTEIRGDEWVLPAEKMKMRRPHVVPLSAQVIELLRQLRELTGGGRWLFPSARGDGRPMSENAVRVALRSMGFTNDDMTPHGFRGMASTRLNEMGWAPDVIERQLAHAENNQVRAAYNRAEYIEKRREMMQAWADWLDGLAGAEHGSHDA